MKIKSIRVVRVNFPPRALKTPTRRESWSSHAEVANPMSRYPHVKRQRSMWQPKFEGAYVQVTAENGVSGYAPLWPARPLQPVIEHFTTS
jgi:hypothetical protein